MSLTRPTEPIVGYRITERLGAGGYGEVWKAEVPGGLHKAVKFIYGYLTDEKAAQELKSLNRIKQFRHPFLLSLERIEVVDGQLVIVTELADMSLKDRFHQAIQSGLPAVPREELLGYVHDAADALDYLGDNALQHLDVKPENLLLVGGRIKVADFGLVKDIHERTCSMMGGMTPVYASPEVFDGRPSPHSDQYSLAIVYQELLTGGLPFPGNTAAQLASQHLHSRPRLEGLPEADRAVIGRALSKNPALRFPTCRAMVEALLSVGQGRGGYASVRGPAGPAPQREQDTDRAPAPRTTPPPPRAAEPIQTEQLNGAGSQGVVQTQSRPEVAATLIDLPPVEIGADAKGLRPTLFLGIGGTAGRVLRGLRRRLTDRFGEPSADSHWRMLLIDTDCKSLGDSARGDERGQLDAAETMPMPLRKAEEYRSRSPEILRWLSRRWMYNIPRSQQTEGLRPLGRLALVDHADALFARLRSALRELTSPDLPEAALRATGMHVRDAVPRVFVIASVSGGTGSGMVLDATYAVRLILAELGIDDRGVCGVLTHATVRSAGNQDLAIANACACLGELRDFSRVIPYPGDPACGLPPVRRVEPTFPTGYFVHMGEHLSDDELQSAADGLAEYLYLDSASGGGGYFDACRTDEDEVEGDVAMRSVGICQLGCSQSDLPARAAELLCRTLVERLAGTAKTARRSPTEPTAESLIEHTVQQALSSISIDAAGLIRQFVDDLGAEVGRSLDDLSRAAVEQVVGSHRVQVEILPAVQQTAQLAYLATEALGLGDPQEDESHAAIVPLAERTECLIQRRGRELAAAFSQKLVELADAPDVRLKGVERAVSRFGEHLRSCEVQLKQQAQAGDERLARWHAAPPIKAAPARRLRFMGHETTDVDPLRERLAGYTVARLESQTVTGTLRLVRGLLANVATWSDQLVGVRHELTRIAGQFEVGPLGHSSGGDRQAESEQVLAAAVRDLEHRIPRAAPQVERQLQESWIAPRGGWLRVLQAGKEELGQLEAAIRVEGRAAVGRLLQEMDLARVVLGSAPGGGINASRLEGYLKTAQPKLAERCGGSRRLLLVVPESSTACDLAQTLEPGDFPRPTVVLDPGCDVVACLELSGLPLSRIVSALSDDNPHYREAARRLHTRVDVEWT